MTTSADTVPRLAGVHHVKLPVSDLERSERWYVSRLGYSRVQEFREDGELMGLLLEHPDGGPPFALRLDPEKARAAAGFDYFSIGVPDRQTIESLGARLTDMGEQHAGVHFATFGWILPMVHDPDGHEVRFYTVQHHTYRGPADVVVMEDAAGTDEQREREHRARNPQEALRA